MAKIEINRLTNANIYMDGNSLLGRAEEIQLPSIKTKMAEHKSLGLIAAVELPAGFDKLEGKIKWAAYYPDVMKKVANPFGAIQLQVRGSLETWAQGSRTAQVPVVVLMTITSKSFPGGNFKQHDNVEAETDFACTYMKQTINGEDIVEIDVLENIFKVAGQDMMAEYRANIGG